MSVEDKDGTAHGRTQVEDATPGLAGDAAGSMGSGMVRASGEPVSGEEALRAVLAVRASIPERYRYILESRFPLEGDVKVKTFELIADTLGVSWGEAVELEREALGMMARGLREAGYEKQDETLS